MSILIVDDHAAMREVIRRIVRQLDDDVYEASDAQEAVRLYAELRPHWVLMDVRMSGEDGISATRRLRASDPAARVIIVTGHPDADTRRAAEAAGAYATVSKDHLSTQLLDVLERHNEETPC